VAWLRRGHDPAPVAAEPDNPVALRQALAALVSEINANSGRLPGACVVTARLLTDVLGEVIDTSSVRPLDVYTLVSVKAMLEDYLPTTLRQFLALDQAQTMVARPSGRTPVESLTEQLEAMLEAVSHTLTAARAQDADALMAQGSFIRTKFSGSDLDL
jgi:hypothetical protein